MNLSLSLEDEIKKDIFLIKKIQNKYEKIYENENLSTCADELIEELNNLLLEIIHKEMDEKINPPTDERN